jgi:hypothetical protein
MNTQTDIEPRRYSVTHLARISAMWITFDAYRSLCLRNEIEWACVDGPMMQMIALIGAAHRAGTEDAIRSVLFDMSEDILWQHWISWEDAITVSDYAAARARGDWTPTIDDLRASRARPNIELWN